MINIDSLYKKTGSRIYIKQPSWEELDFVTLLWADYETMKGVGGPIIFQDSRKKDWYLKMVKPTDCKNFFCLIYDLSDKPVGEVSFHRYDENTKTAEINVKVLSIYRRNGYAKEAVALMLEYYFNEFHGETMVDGIALTNTNGQNLLLDIGFEHISTADNIFLVGITKEKYAMRTHK